MKIIAATKYTLLVEMDPSELQQLSLSHQRLQGDLQYHVGKEFRVDPAFRRIQALRDNHQDLLRVAAQFKAMGELLTPVVTEVERLTEGEVSP